MRNFGRLHNRSRYVKEANTICIHNFLSIRYSDIKLRLLKTINLENLKQRQLLSYTRIHNYININKMFKSKEYPFAM